MDYASPWLVERGLDRAMNRQSRVLSLGASLALSVLVAGVFAVVSPHPGLAGDSIRVKAGGVIAVTPRYEGSKDYRVVGFPFIAPAGLGGGLVQFNGPEDLRFRLLRSGGFEAGPLVGYRFSREEDDAARLRGLGDVDGSFVAGGFAAYTMGAVKPFISYHYGFSGDDEDTGGLLRFGAEVKGDVSSIALKATIGATYADDTYMDTFFSVSQAQSNASVAGLAAYDADAGIKDVYFGLSADVPLSERWGLKLMGRYSHLLGDAADSPIVETESQWFGGAGLTYTFDFSR